MPTSSPVVRHQPSTAAAGDYSAFSGIFEEETGAGAQPQPQPPWQPTPGPFGHAMAGPDARSPEVDFGAFSAPETPSFSAFSQAPPASGAPGGFGNFPQATLASATADDFAAFSSAPPPAAVSSTAQLHAPASTASGDFAAFASAPRPTPAPDVGDFSSQRWAAGENSFGDFSTATSGPAFGTATTGNDSFGDFSAAPGKTVVEDQSFGDFSAAPAASVTGAAAFGSFAPAAAPSVGSTREGPNYDAFRDLDAGPQASRATSSEFGNFAGASFPVSTSSGPNYDAFRQTATLHAEVGRSPEMTPLAQSGPDYDAFRTSQPTTTSNDFGNFIAPPPPAQTSSGPGAFGDSGAASLTTAAGEPPSYHQVTINNAGIMLLSTPATSPSSFATPDAPPAATVIAYTELLAHFGPPDVAGRFGGDALRRVFMTTGVSTVGVYACCQIRDPIAHDPLPVDRVRVWLEH
jgi:hypothetical protein